VESKRAALSWVSAGLERPRQQLTRLQSRAEELTRQLAGGEAPLEALGETLEAALQQRGHVEQELGRAREALEGAEARMRSLDQSRVDAETSVEEARAALEDEIGRAHV